MSVHVHKLHSLHCCYEQIWAPYPVSQDSYKGLSNQGLRLLNILSNQDGTVSSQHLFNIVGLLWKLAWADGRWQKNETGKYSASIMVNTPPKHLLEGILVTACVLSGCASVDVFYIASCQSAERKSGLCCHYNRSQCGLLGSWWIFCSSGHCFSNMPGCFAFTQTMAQPSGQTCQHQGSCLCRHSAP